MTRRRFVWLSLGLALGLLGMAALDPLAGDDLWRLALERLALWGALAGILRALSVRRPRRERIPAVGSAAWLVAVPAALALALAVENGRGGVPLAEGWPGILLRNAAVCVALAGFEETLFRGLLLHGLLSASGGTRRGIFLSAAAESLLFGAAHVASYLAGGAYTPLGLAQAAGKLLTAGVVGLYLSALSVRTENFPALALLHGGHNFFGLAATLYGEPALAGYVFEGAAGVRAAGFYGVLLALYAPLLLTAIRLLREQETPCWGLLVPREAKNGGEK